MSAPAETPPQTQPVGRIIAMPADTNPEGDIFGGWLLAQMDLAGATPAFELAHGRCATVALDGMVFHQPVAVGDEVSLYAHVVSSGRTSSRVHVEAWKRARGQPQAASDIVAAIERNLREGRIKTYDLGGSSTTSEVGSEIARLVGLV